MIVGIYGAFAVEAWNESRKEENEEKVILQQLHEDLLNAKSQSEQLITNEKKALEILQTVLGTSEQVDSLFKSQNIDKAAITIFWDFEHELPVLRFFEDLKNSGKSGIIKNVKIRKQLSDLQQGIDKLDCLFKDRKAVHITRVDAIAESNLNFLAMIKSPYKPRLTGEHSDYRSLIQNQRIRNLTGIKLQVSTEVLNSRNTLDKHIADLIFTLEEKIKLGETEY